MGVNWAKTATTCMRDSLSLTLSNCFNLGNLFFCLVRLNQLKETRNKERTKKMLYSKLMQGETRSHGAQMWNGRMEARGHP